MIEEDIEAIRDMVEYLVSQLPKDLMCVECGKQIHSVYKNRETVCSGVIGLCKWKNIRDFK